MRAETARSAQQRPIESWLLAGSGVVDVTVRDEVCFAGVGMVTIG